MILALGILGYLAIGVGIFAWRFRVEALKLDLFTIKRWKNSPGMLLEEVEILGMPGTPACILLPLLWPGVLILAAGIACAKRCPNLLWALIDRDVTTRAIAEDLTNAKSPATQSATQGLASLGGIGQALSQAQMQQWVNAYSQNITNPQWVQATFGLGPSQPPSGGGSSAPPAPSAP